MEINIYGNVDDKRERSHLTQGGLVAWNEQQTGGRRKRMFYLIA